MCLISRAFHWLSLTPAAVVVGVLLLLCACSKQGKTVSEEKRVVGATVVYASASGGVSADRFSSMRWEDIAPTAETILRHGLSDEVMKVSAGVENSACRYLRGMLELAHSRPHQAAAEWQKIPLDQIPVDALYAPWRLAAESAVENRYAKPLAEAVKAGKTSSLVAARWHALAGDFLPSLEEYLATDPAQWTPHEIEQFRIMKLHAPVASDVDRLLAGALAGKRLPKELRGSLAQLIKIDPAPNMQCLEELLKTNPEFAEAATRAAARQLELRQAFAANRFDEVLEKSRAMNLTEAPTETVLLIFLSASQRGDHATADRWAEELLRRNPGSENQTWIDNIRKSSR